MKNSMKGRINRSLIGMGVVTMLVTAAICLSSLSAAYIQHVRRDMETTGDMLCRSYELENTEALSLFNQEGMRITLISPEGSVLYESAGSAQEMDNHLERPEVREALEGGKGEAHRESRTFLEDTYYYARLLKDGNILRVALRTNSIFSMYAGVIIAVVAIGAVIISVSVLISMLLTRKMMEPVQNMAKHLERVGELTVYEELRPLSEALSAYQKRTYELERVRQEFTANVSHELKTPLTTISGYAEMMENGMVKDKDISGCAGKIHKEANRMLTLIGDILELSRLDEPEMKRESKSVNLYAVAARCVEAAQLSAQKHGIRLYLQGDGCVVEGEEGMLEELTANLCDNSIRYNRPGGRVTVTVMKDFETGGTVLSVEDTGIGISEEDQRRIFERFYRVDKGRSRETGGTGLGLAIVKHIVQQHGARLQIKSALNQGTRIDVIFPPVGIPQESVESKT